MVEDSNAGRSTCRLIKRCSLLGLVAVVAIGGATPMQPPLNAQAPGERCTVAFMQAAAPADTTVVSATLVHQPIPLCKVEGYSITTNPGPNKVGFGLQLPLKPRWNGRYYFIGVGGSGGGAVPSDASFATRVAAGFATAGTDKGHPGISDWSFALDPAKALDNAHRGAHVSTVAAQALTKAYYGVQKMYRYHTGCSGGGDMGIKALQKHPGDYDGILLGWPGGNYPDPKRASTPANFHGLVREMTREPGAWLSPAKRQFVERKVTEACDLSDGAKDEMIWDHQLCKFDFSTLACKGGDNGECLTPPEVRSFTNMIKNTQFPISNITGWFYVGDKPPPWNPDKPQPGDSLSYTILNGWARTHLRDPNLDVQKRVLTPAEIQLIAEGQAKAGNTKLGGELGVADFARLGGKAIFYVGVGDPCCSNLSLRNWFAQTIQHDGLPIVNRSARLYEIPGWGHCGGPAGPGDGVDRMLAALIDWVEKGKAPREIKMHRGSDRVQPVYVNARRALSNTENAVAASTGLDGQKSLPSRDFLVCPYPLISVFDRSKANVPGAVYEAKNWSCRPRQSIVRKSGYH